MTQPTPRVMEWRIIEALKILRQCQTCPTCGCNVCTERGIQLHLAWHETTDQYVAGVSEQFDAIDTYVRGEGGLEDQIRAAIADQVTATTVLRTDATNAINTLRTDATNAITALTARVSTIEQELTRPVTGILARLNALELL